MNWRSLLLLLPAVLIGCASPPAQTAASTPGQPAPVAPAKANTPASDAPKTVDAEPQAPVDPREVPTRIHQLRDLKTVDIRGGAKPIKAWVMDDDSKRREGMMFLTDKHVKDEEGMLFVFEDDAPRSFWMQNTLLPLDILYVDAGKRIVSIVQGKPLDESPLPSGKPARYVLELKAGRAKVLKLGVGTVLDWKVPRDR